jgi:hypothetical protein
LFKFLKGIFLGDPYRGIIYLVVFNPIIQFIKQHQETHGYTLKTKTNVKNVSTTPFADDFNIISREIMKHHTLLIEHCQGEVHKHNISTERQNLWRPCKHSLRA